TSTGAVYGWGNNAFGQIGPSGGAGSSTPVLIIPTGAISISAGFNHALATFGNLSTGVGVSVWGRNLEGQLGLGDNDNRNTPTPLVGGAPSFSKAVAGGHHTMVQLFSNGPVYATGLNTT